MPVRRYVRVFTFALAALAGVQTMPPLAAQSSRPKLVVLVVVDQMRADYLERYKADISAGFRRLTTDGAVFTQAYYPYASTETAQGHATMLTGQSPRVTGIVGDSWLDRSTGSVVVAGESQTHKLVDGSPRGGSPEQLLVGTLGDALKAQDRKSITLTTSWKRYAAVLLGGQHADAAYWFDSTTGHMVTSDYYRADDPAWVTTFNATDPTARFFGSDWLGHHLGAGPAPTQAFRDSLRATPFANDVLLDFTTKLLASTEVGRDDIPDVLGVSFSALDYVGHTYGPETPEFDDTFRRVDRSIGALMDALDEKVGKGAWTMALVADHGAALQPEKMKARGEDAGRIDARAFRAAVVNELSEKFKDADNLILAFDPPEFYLDYAEGTRRKLDAAALEKAVAAACAKQPGIAEVYTRQQILAVGPSSSAFLKAIAEGFYPTRSGDVYMIQKPNYIFYAGAGTTHGTPYEYDQHVPLIFYGSGVLKGTRNERVLVNDLAPTLAAIAAVPMPGLPGHVLSDAVAVPAGSVR